MTIEREELEQLIHGIHEASTSPMRQVCIEKVLVLIDDKLASHYRIINLETKTLIMGLRDEIREDVKVAIQEAMAISSDKTRWGVEVLKLVIYIGTVIGIVKILAL